MKNILLEDCTKTLATCLEILTRKNADYATDKDPFENFKNSEVVGVSMERGLLVRVMDKISRINVLIDKEPDVVEESINDTINDAIGYLAILSSMLKNNK